MSEHARRLLSVLAGKGICRVDATGMRPAEVEQAVVELGQMFDDDNRPLVMVNTWHVDDRIMALELTAAGRGLASSAQR